MGYNGVYQSIKMDIAPRRERSFKGCWTCRVRRKKCDENQPICGNCKTLHVDCYYSEEKPEWMETSKKEMIQQLKRQIKENRRLGLTVNESQEGQEGQKCQLSGVDYRITFNKLDNVLLMFYIEHVFPFLFPFYKPSCIEGGKAWILEMMMSSPVVQRAILCQSSYFFSLARGSSNDIVCASIIKQTRDAFEVLREALKVISNSEIKDHLPAAVRILSSIIQVQRFEIATSSFENCHVHLNAAIALFKDILNSVESIDSIFQHLADSNLFEFLTAEQAAFQFSSSLLIFDDIVASTIRQQAPKLWEYRNLLGKDSPLNFESVIGCENVILLQIGEIAVLDTWKQECKKVGNLDVMELVHRAGSIKNILIDHLNQLSSPRSVSRKPLLDFLIYDSSTKNQSYLVTTIWTHSALLYLNTVVSGWQPSNTNTKYHVNQIIKLLKYQISPPELIRTMIWPLCIAGCLAEPSIQHHFREIIQKLTPATVFGTAKKALEIMENVWTKERNADWGLASCFQSQGDLVLLV
jgi:C6 transcription factor Pro1